MEQPATIRYSEDRKHFTLEVGSDEFEPEAVTEEGVVVIDDGEGAIYEVILENYTGDALEVDTVYKLTKLSTQVAETV
jgi:hypothetical protein